MSATARKMVVVVEDEDEICDTLRDVFEDEGYAVAVARDGAAALALLTEIPVKPHAVVLDLILPIVDGNAVYSLMRADPRLADVPVVVSTSDPARAPAGVAVMRKPFNLDALLTAVRQCG